MANNESNYTAVSLPKELAEEIRADADQLAKKQNRLKPVSMAEMITIAYRIYKQGEMAGPSGRKTGDE